MTIPERLAQAEDYAKRPESQHGQMIERIARAVLDAAGETGTSGP